MMGLFRTLKTMASGGDEAAAEHNLRLVAQNITYIYLRLKENYAHKFNGDKEILAMSGIIDLPQYLQEGSITIDSIYDEAERATDFNDDVVDILREFNYGIQILICTSSAPKFMKNSIMIEIAKKLSFIESEIKKEISAFRSGHRRDWDAVIESGMSEFR